ncbi:MAG: M1 family aminopeptidase [Bacteroidota bacterium]|nr:M1 family aminopeptidase [Bacteroidota bacterium]MDP3146384.1 M1 family aminopeptidase [Bacteroidota bacterium]
MTKRVLINAIAISFIAAACHNTKKATTSIVDNEPSIHLDTISVVANEVPKKEVYQESNPRSNDIIHTKLEVNFDWTNSKMNGKALIEIKPYFYPTNMLYLNARGMDIISLKISEVTFVQVKKKEDNKTIQIAEETLSEIKNSSYKYENDSLKINLGRVFTNKEKYLVEISYVSKPDELKSGGSNAISGDKGLYFINPTGENKFKMPQIWTQGETQSNSAWFPTIDSPNEKMTQDIFMTVDEKYTTLSNGLLVDSKKNSDGTRTDHWEMKQAHSPYLAMMAVGEFRKVVDAPWNGKEVSYYVEKEYEPHAKAIFGDTKEMIEFYSNKLGVPYAWPKYAQIAVRDYVSGAMENTSATLHGDFAVYQTTRETIDGVKGNSIIAHELFHQWFGDLVTCESWSNLPLNESFATYGEYLWEEYKFGRDAADYHHYNSREGYMNSSKEVDLIRFDYDEREDMFDGFSYNKGGQVLHMLRKAVGDDAFFASLKNYLETNKFKTGEIHNLRLAFEETTGLDMNWFFNQWFLNKGRPKLIFTKNYNATENNLVLTVEQTQNFKKYPLYTLPIEIDVYANGKVERTKITVTEAKQTFTVKVSSNPQLVNFDAERHLLCDLDYSKTQTEYIFQYKNAPLFLDRYEALKKLDSKLADADVYNVFKLAAENDKYHVVRNYAITKLIEAPTDKLPEVKTILLSVYAKDNKTKTRAKALSLLNKKFASDADIIALNNTALGEQSYAICGEALEAISKSNPKLAMEKAKLFENEKGKDVLYPIAELYSTNGGDEQVNFFHNNLGNFNGFEVMGFIGLYSKTAKRCSTEAAVNTAVDDLYAIGKGGSRFTKYSAAKGIKDIATVWESKEKALKSKIETAKKESKDVTELEKELKSTTAAKDSFIKKYNEIKS